MQDKYIEEKLIIGFGGQIIQLVLEYFNSLTLYIKDILILRNFEIRLLFVS